MSCQFNPSRLRINSGIFQLQRNSKEVVDTIIAERVRCDRYSYNEYAFANLTQQVRSGNFSVIVQDDEITLWNLATVPITKVWSHVYPNLETSHLVVGQEKVIAKVDRHRFILFEKDKVTSMAGARAHRRFIAGKCIVSIARIGRDCMDLSITDDQCTIREPLIAGRCLIEMTPVHYNDRYVVVLARDVWIYDIAMRELKRVEYRREELSLVTCLHDKHFYVATRDGEALSTGVLCVDLEQKSATKICESTEYIDALVCNDNHLYISVNVGTGSQLLVADRRRNHEVREHSNLDFSITHHQIYLYKNLLVAVTLGSIRIVYDLVGKQIVAETKYADHVSCCANLLIGWKEGGQRSYKLCIENFAIADSSGKSQIRL